MEVIQQTDTAEQVADKVFKPEIARPVSSDFDTRRRKKFQFDPMSNIGDSTYHIVRTENYPFTSQHLRLRRVNHLRRAVFARRQTFDAIKTAPPALTSKTDTSFAYLVESKHHPRQQVDSLTDQNQVTGECIPRRVCEFTSPRWLKDKRMRRKRLTAEDRAILRHRRFKALGINASVGELAHCLARICIANTSDVSKRISKSTAEGVAFVLGESQRFLDGVSEAVAGKAEVLEHGGDLEFCLFFSPMKLMKSRQIL